MASFSVDRTIDGGIESRRLDLSRKLELTAKTATKKTKSILKTDIDFVDNVQDSLGVLLGQIRNYLYLEDSQIRNIRQFLALETDKVSKVDSVVPASIAADTLAVLSGASYNPSTSEVGRDDIGGYVVGGATSLGMLYMSSRVIDAFSDGYEEEFGVRPGLTIEWVHLTPRPRSLPAHESLGGVKFTASTAAEVLKNNSVPWLGPYFYVRDHRGCRCYLRYVLR